MTQPRESDEVYTRVTAEIKYADGQETKIVIQENLWDADLEKMREMLENLLLALGYAPELVYELFNPGEEEEENYVLLSNIEDELDDDDDAAVGPEPVNPCCGCDCCCDDTACLVDWPIVPVSPRSIG